MTDYDKWNAIEDASDNESPGNGNKFMAAPAKHDLRLLTVPWDTSCEQVRWSMDKLGMGYTDCDYPWGLHLLATIPYSENKLSLRVPVLIKNPDEANAEVYQYDNTKILVYLYAQGLFSSGFRMYAKTETVDLQEYFDQTLAPATRIIYLSTVLQDFKLIQKYIFGTIHLNTWNTTQRLFWPLIYVALCLTYNLSQKSVENAWKVVDACFDRVEKQLKSHGQGFLMGKDMSAADIAFASHAALALLPSDDDLWAESVSMKLPKLSEIPRHVSERIKKHRASPAGLFAIRLYKKERGHSLCRKLSKHSIENNPLWARSEMLRNVAVLTLPAIFLAQIACLLILPLHLNVAMVFFSMLIGVFIVADRYKIPVLIAKSKQCIAFIKKHISNSNKNA